MTTAWDARLWALRRSRLGVPDQLQLPPGVGDVVHFTSNASYTVNFSSGISNYYAYFQAQGGTITLNVGAGNTWTVTPQGQFASIYQQGNGSTVELSSGNILATYVLPGLPAFR